MANKDANRSTPARLNIYLPTATRRQVKTAAAKRDLSLSEYCLRAISAQLIRDGERWPEKESPGLSETAVTAARRFQKQTFHGQIFAVSSAELIQEARESRTPR